MKNYTSLSDLECHDKVVLLRCDLNVPMKNGIVTDRTRIDRSLPTIRALARKGAKIVILSHFGRPRDKEAGLSLRQLVQPLSAALGIKVAFADDCIGAPAKNAIAKLAKGDILLLENLRFHAGEEKNDPAFIKELASLGQFYVNDAFSCAHRPHASTEGLAHALPHAIGLSMEDELKHLAAILERPEKPVLAIVGGAKVSTKLDLLSNLCTKMQFLAIGGGMANTFLAAEGQEIGKSLAEREMVGTAKSIMERAREHHCEILLPRDVVIAKELRDGIETEIVALQNMKPDRMILDIGPASIERLKSVLDRAKSLVWNGPLGAFEVKPFDRATTEIARYAAQLTGKGKLISVAGGGDTIAALGDFGAHFTYISTAGGAFLEWLEGKELPGVLALRRAHPTG